MTGSQQGAASQRRAPEAEEAFRTAEGPDAEELKLWKAGPRYEIVRKLGSGSYGTVFEAKDTQDGRAVAVKRVELIDDTTHFRRTLREVCLLGMLRGHRNIVELLDVVAPLQETGGFDEIYLVMERCKLDLRKFFRSEHTVTQIQAQRILYTAARGLAYLHSGGIWHRDLKPDNLLMNSDCEVKIADYGLSRAVGWCDFRRAGLDGASEDPLLEMFHLKARPEEQLTVRVCTRWYRAPELLLGQSDYTEAVDVWSLGCIFAELLQCLTGFPPCDRRGPLFPGDYCRRPGRDRVDQVVQMPTPSRRAARDMLELVFDVIGTPSDLDLGLLRREKDRKHISSFPRRDGCGIRARVPEADDDALDVLGRVLLFSASDRATARDLLRLPFFDQVREVDKERLAPGILNLRFEEEPDDMHRLEPYLVKEIQRYQRLD